MMEDLNSCVMSGSIDCRKKKRLGLLTQRAPTTDMKVSSLLPRMPTQQTFTSVEKVSTFNPKFYLATGEDPTPRGLPSQVDLMAGTISPR